MMLARSVEGIIAVDSPLNEDLPVPLVSVSGHKHREGVINIELDHDKAAAPCALASKVPGAQAHRLHQGPGLQFRYRSALAGDCRGGPQSPISRSTTASWFNCKARSRALVPAWKSHASCCRVNNPFTAIFAFNDVTCDRRDLCAARSRPARSRKISPCSASTTCWSPRCTIRRSPPFISRCAAWARLQRARCWL